MSEILKRINSFFALTGIPAELTDEEKLLIVDGLLQLYVDKEAKKLIIERGETEATEKAKELLEFKSKSEEISVSLANLINWGSGAKLEIDTKGKVNYSSGNQEIRLFARYEKPRRDRPYLILGFEGNRIETEELFGEISLSVSGSRKSAALATEGRISGGRFVFGAEGLDGFLSSILPGEGFAAGFDLEFGLSSEKGLYFKGSSGLELVIPLHQELGPIELKTLFLGAKIDSEERALSLELGLSIGATLGPFSMVIEQIGAKGQFLQRNNGAIFNQFDFDMGFLPPKGIGLSVDAAGLMKGGGYLFLDHDKGEYAGVAELAVVELVHIKAICLITTQMPDGKPGYSFLLLISAEFTPIQLGFGFTLNGVGGLVGVHRAINTQAILEGVRTGSLQDILFPENPVAEAPRILRSIGHTFPAQRDQYSFGIMGIIGWGIPTLVEVRLGFMIQVPEVRIAILGLVGCAIPHKKLPLIQINAAFSIVLDTKEKLIAFDASLFDSRILWMEMYGDMALRIKYGDQADFLLSLGGFHPDYNPPAALRVGNMRRLTNAILSGNPRLQIEYYFAITSNTVQFGSKMDFYFALADFKIIGFFGYDALFQFSPFYFKVSLEAYLAVKLGSLTLLSVYLYGALSGPNPWNFKGIGEFTVLMISFGVSFDVTWPDDHTQEQLESIEVLPLLTTALSDARNWESKFPGRKSSLTTLRDTKNEIETLDDGTDGAERVDTLLAHPFGELSVRQKVLPLDSEISRFGQFQPIDGNVFEISEYNKSFSLKETTVGNTEDQFAADQFFNLSEAEKMQRPAFEAFTSGVVLSDNDYVLPELNEDGIVTAIHAKRSAMHEFSRWDDYNDGIEDQQEPEFISPTLTPVQPEIFDMGIRFTQVAKSALGRQASFNQKYFSEAPSLARSYALTNKNTLETYQELDATMEFSNMQAAKSALESMKQTNPNLAKDLQVSMV